MVTLTPPGSSNALLPFGTPVHTRSSTTRYFDAKHLSRDQIVRVMSLEMAPFFLGPMPPGEFLSTFLPSSQPSGFQPGMFDTLANLRTEPSMYKKFINVVQPYLKTIHIRETSRSPDKAITDARDICIEFKIRSEDDAFLTDFSDGASVSGPNRLMSRNQKGITTAGQITIYAALQLDCQYRTHVFSVLIVKDYARLIRWDRSGAIVTAPIYYRRDPELLDFFTRYDQAERPARGHDGSVRSATPAEVQKAVHADDDFCTSQGLLVVTVPHQVGSSCGEYIIKPPVARFYTPPGRATRTSIAYDIHKSRIVFFKDSWRVACDGIMREGELYKILNDAKIPNIPYCSASGDVGEDTYHFTRTHAGQFVDAPWALISPTHVFTPHRHHQLILDDVGKKLEMFRCSRDMVRAIRAALIAHRDAYEKCGVLHRDISANNILLTECPRFEGGLLIDWDLCKMVDPGDPMAGGARQSTRTGTWQFMAADLIENPKINQTFIHDIESAFLVLLWMATHYVQAELGPELLSGIVNLVFDPQVFGGSGAPTKSMFMRGEQELKKIVFRDNAPLTRLLLNLRELLGVRHQERPEAPSTHEFSVNTMIHQALHEGAQGTESPSKPTTANEPSQEKLLYEAQLTQYETQMSALQSHKAAIYIITAAINPDIPWPAVEPAKRQALILPLTERWVAHSGSKRCRDVAVEGESGDLVEREALPKRNKSL
ncbi:hypothetical protein EDB84DRAFT_1572373 [Lactarius hengduanensis]|nr:hypothetical protein EDB84DRAFT_1572373 [Lactarius hengduanensis]